MANGRNLKKDNSRDAGAFIALPWSVVDCPAYIALSYPAKAMLIELARQYGGRNLNGTLLATSKYLQLRGWKSNALITRVLRELVEAGFIYQTVKGHRPNKASWYALTWYSLDKSSKYDYGAEAGFIRSAYRKKCPEKIKSLKPSTGLSTRPVALAKGVSTTLATPQEGAISLGLPNPPTPAGGDHLDTPSASFVASVRPLTTQQAPPT